MIKSEAARVDGTGPEVLDVEIERLHDARREKDGGAGCCQMPSRTRNQPKDHKESSWIETRKFGTRCAPTWLLPGLGGGAGLAGDEHAGAGALALGAGRGEEHGAHAGRARRRLLRLQQRGPGGRVEGVRRGNKAGAGGSFWPADARAPRRRRSGRELLLLLMLEHLLLLQGVELGRKKPRRDKEKENDITNQSAEKNRGKTLRVAVFFGAGLLT